MNCIVISQSVVKLTLNLHGSPIFTDTQHLFQSFIGAFIGLSSNDNRVSGLLTIPAMIYGLLEPPKIDSKFLISFATTQRQPNVNHCFTRDTTVQTPTLQIFACKNCQVLYFFIVLKDSLLNRSDSLY